MIDRAELRRWITSWMNQNAAVATRVEPGMRGYSDPTLVMAAFDLQKLVDDLAEKINV